MKENAQRIVNLKKVRNKRTAFLVIVLLQVLAVVLKATTCYPNINLPRMIAQDNDNKKVWLQAAASSETLNAVFIGGFTETDKVNGRTGKYAVIARLDLDQNTWAWR